MPRVIWRSFQLQPDPHPGFAAHGEPRADTQLRMLDRRDFAPVGYQRYSKTSGREVEWSDRTRPVRCGGSEQRPRHAAGALYCSTIDRDFRSTVVRSEAEISARGRGETC